jgi:lipid-A-disaccharide synthase
MTKVEDRRAPHIMVVAGEASGDLHGGALCRALRSQAPGARLFGMGGRAMAAAGVELRADISGTAVVGFTEVVRRLPALRRTYRRLASALAERPAALVLIDFPGMNLRLAALARQFGVPVVYFIPPQVWAWRQARVRKIRERVSLVLAVLPFELTLYRQAGIRTEFVGHPLLDALVGAPTRDEARRQLGIDAGARVIGLLPGSRAAETARMTPLLSGAAAGIAARHPDTQFLLAVAPTVAAADIERHLAGGPPLRLVPASTYAVMRAADLLLVTSGTATLEAALLGTPMVVCYRMSRISEMISRALIRVPWISLVNIVLGRAVVPELCLRRDATPARVTAAALALLDVPGELAAQREAFAELTAALGAPGVAPRAARLVLTAAGVPA